MRRDWVRYLYIAAGSLSLVIGVAGVFLPLLPGTPFILLSAWCFERGSERFHFWIVNHRWFGPAIRDWRLRGAISVRHKALASAMMLFGAVLLLSKPTIPMMGKAAYSLVLACVLAFIWSRKSK